MRRVFSVFLIIVGLVVMFASAISVQAEGLKEISAKAINDHGCDDTERVFVITQIDTLDHVPPNVTVTFTNGTQEVIDLEKFTGGTAHYKSVQNLDLVVQGATAMIYEEWDGQFNLSHGPCDTPTPTATDTDVPPTATDTVVPPTGTPTLTDTVVPPTNTPTTTENPTATDTVVPPTGTPTLVTNTPTGTLTITDQPTNTPTLTDTVVPPTGTPTLVTNTPTDTVVPPTGTPITTDTVVPPTATNTPKPQETGAGGGLGMPLGFYIGGLMAVIGLLGLIFKA